MIYLNELRRKRFLTSLLNYFLPEEYSAITISDFLKEKDKVKVTKKWMPTGCLFNDAALIFLANPVTYNDLNKEKQSEVEKPGAIEVGKISDLTSALLVVTKEPYSNYIKGLIKPLDGMHLYDAILVYHPKSDLTFLADYHSHGGLYTEKERRDATSTQMRAPAYSS